jgi:predicted heme/steroid binding protein
MRLALTLEEVSRHSSVSSAWLIVKGQVYDVTDFASEHPGGKAILLSNAGTDVTGATDYAAVGSTFLTFQMRVALPWQNCSRNCTYHRS